MSGACFFTAIHATGAPSVTLTWDANVEPGIARYELSYGESSGVYSSIVDAGLGTIIEVGGLTEGKTYYFVVSAYSAGGIKSLPSSQVSYTVPQNDPPPNTVPSAIAQTASTAEDTPLNINLTGTDAEGATLNYAVAAPPQNGTLIGTAPNLTYMPAANFSGDDRFTFQVNDGTLTSATATVTITVTAVNDAPLATAKSVTTAEDTSLPITLTGTDSDANSLTFSVVVAPAHGTLTGTAPNLTYSPAANFSGADSFTFRVNDGTVNSATATISITVTPAPSGIWTLHYVDSQESQTYQGAHAFDGNPSTFWHTAWSGSPTPPPHEIQINLGASENITGFRYLPRQDTRLVGNVGQFEFYVSADGANWGAPVATGIFPNTRDLKEIRFAETSARYIRLRGLSDANGGIYMTVAELGVIQDSQPSVTNQAPLALSKSISTEEDTAANIALQATDADGNTLSFSVVSAPTRGSLSGTAPNLTYTPSQNYHGTDSFTYLANDGTVNSATATVSITVTAVNDAPVAITKSVSVAENASLPITLTGTDLEGNPLAFSVLGGPANGLLSGTAPNLTYYPGVGFNGSDAISFRVSDGQTNSAPATISITVTPVNDAPNAISKSVSTTEDSSLSITLDGGDPDGDPLTFTLVGSPTNGTLSGTAPNLTYQPAANFNGSDAFSFRVNDGTVWSLPATVSITVTAVNDTPLATAKSVTTDTGSALPITLAGTDPDGDSLTFAVVDPPTHGTLAGAAPNLIYSPAANHTGTDQFTFLVNDGSASSPIATVSITVTAVNTPPVFIADLIAFTATEHQAFTGQALAFDADPSDVLTFQKVSGPAWLTVSASGKLDGTPLAADVGTASFIVKASDRSNASATATLNITVANINDAPVFAVKPLVYPAGTEKEPYLLSLANTATDSDPSDTITYSKVDGPAWLVIGESGALSGTPPDGSVGTNLFTIRATDAAGAFDETTLQIKININDLPLPWYLDRVGTSNLAGAGKFSSGIFTVAGAGLLADRQDSGTFVWQTLTGDGKITARVSKLNNPGKAARVGVMIRESLATNSCQIFMGVNGSSTYHWLRRSSTGGSVSKSTKTGPAAADIWVHLVRSGNAVTAFRSTNGTSWSKMGSSNVTMSKNCYIGLWVSSGSNTLLTTSLFDKVEVTP